MAWGFLESVVFAGVMAIRDQMKEEKKEAREREIYQAKEEDFQEKAVAVSNDVSALLSDINDIVTSTCKKSVPVEFSKGLRYIALFCFSLVIGKQGYTSKNQDRVIDFYFDNIEYDFSKHEFLNSIEFGYDVGDFGEVMAINSYAIGSFWTQCFRALVKIDNVEVFKNFMLHIHSLITNFANLGRLSESTLEEIWNEFCDAVDKHLESSIEIQDDEIDWMGITPLADNMANLKSHYENLIELSEFPNEDGSMNQMLDMIILNAVCDIVMAMKQPKSIKLGMINSAFEFLEMEPFIDPEVYVTSVANKTELGMVIKEAASIGNPLGMCWKIIVDMSASVGADKGMELITVDLFEILNQIETFLYEKYNLTCNDSIAQKYISSLLKSVGNYCKEKANE